jgi:hypothetical protein
LNPDTRGAQLEKQYLVKIEGKWKSWFICLVQSYL